VYDDGWPHGTVRHAAREARNQAQRRSSANEARQRRKVENREEEHMKGIPLIILAVSLGAVGQIVMKRGMQLYGEVDATSVWGQLIPILKVPQVTIGLACYALSAVFWIAVVSQVDLSLAYPMVSLAYVIVFIASWLLLGEQIPPLRLIGLLIIVAGVIVISRS